RRVLPAARRAGGVRASARSRRHDARSAVDLRLGRRGRRRARRRHRRRRARRPPVSGVPVIKEPVWKPEIPFYFYSGGLGGASAGLAALSELAGNRELARRAWVAALAGAGASPALLIADLGVPARFVNMLRMFKVSSPMSMGS